jgi:hypothetical protein
MARVRVRDGDRSDRCHSCYLFLGLVQWRTPTHCTRRLRNHGRPNVFRRPGLAFRGLASGAAHVAGTGTDQMWCHPERRGGFAERSHREVEGPLIDADQDECGKAFSLGCRSKFPARTLPGYSAMGSFDCVVVPKRTTTSLRMTNFQCHNSAGWSMVPLPDSCGSS